MTLPMGVLLGDYLCINAMVLFSSELTSKVASFLRMMPTSVACKGATACFISTACFFTLFHCSGSSCRENEQEVKYTAQSFYDSSVYTTCIHCSKVSEGGVINMNLGPLSKELELNFYLLNSN